MNAPHRWDIFCTVIDNHGDLGVCWRLARQLVAMGHAVRLWVDDASALAWMAPGGAIPTGLQLMPWDAARRPEVLQALPPAHTWVEAFGCQIPDAFVAHGVASQTQAPRWFNLEYLSAETWVGRMHGLPSPVMGGPAKGWTKHFFYPGFTPETGGLLREPGLLAQQESLDRAAWRQQHAPSLPKIAWLISLFCYEPAGLPWLLRQLVDTPHHLLVTPGRPLGAVQQALACLPVSPSWSALPYTDQSGFDQMLWACDLNLVRGEDSLVRALWAGQALVWHIYPQEDQAHHVKLEAFLDWLQAPQSLRRFHRVWNGIEAGELPTLDSQTLAQWAQCTRAARERLLKHKDLCSQLMDAALVRV